MGLYHPNRRYRNIILIMGLYHPNRKYRNRMLVMGLYHPNRDRRYRNRIRNGIRGRNRIIPMETEY